MLLISVVLFVSIRVVSAAPPAQPPSLISFADNDIDSGEIGGAVDVYMASSESDVDSYQLYYGRDSSTRLIPLASMPKTGEHLQHFIPFDTPIPSVGGVAATHLLVFTKNADGEGMSGPNVAIIDKAVPLLGAQSVLFADTDYDKGQIGGIVSINRATNEDDVTNYMLYYGSSSTAQLSFVASIDKTQSASSQPVTHVFGSGTALPSGATHFLAYTANLDGLTRAVISVDLIDRGVPQYAPLAIEFEDSDYVKGEIGGLILITKASDESEITHYVVYYGSSSTTKLALVAFVSVTGGPVYYILPSDTVLPAGATHLLAFSRNNDGEMQTGVSTPLVDKWIPVHTAEAVFFNDQDPDVNELAGIVTIVRAVDEADITHYTLYFGSDAGTPTVEIADISWKDNSTGANESLSVSHTFGLHTPLPSGATHLLVRTRNEDGPMNYGIFTPLKDNALPTHAPQGISFSDVDIDGGEIGGIVQISKASSESDVVGYVLYYGNSGTATAAHKLGLITRVDATGNHISYTLPNQLLPGGATHLLVFSYNDDGEMYTGVSVLIVDKTGDFPQTYVSSVTFADFNLLLGRIGGSVGFIETEVTGMQKYIVYLAEDAGGTNRQVICNSVAIGSQGAHASCPVPNNTVASTNFHFLVYKVNNLGEGLQPATVAITDIAVPTAVVSGLSFFDSDTGVSTIGGTLTWTEPTIPSDASLFDKYAIYVAGSPDLTSGLNLHKGDVAVGTSSFILYPGIEIVNFSHALVYTVNSHGRALTAASLAFVDKFLPDVAVPYLQFFDQDLGVGEIGGYIGWRDPGDESTVGRYDVHLLDSITGTRLKLGETARGERQFLIPYNTDLLNFTDVLVVAMNDAGESPLTATVTIVDRTAESCPAEFGHGFKSAQWRIVAGKVSTAWRIRTINFFSDHFCTSRIQTLPSTWPKQPRQARGAAFANPHAPRHLDSIFKLAKVTDGTWQNGTRVGRGGSYVEEWWSSGGPCMEDSKQEIVNRTDLPVGSSECYVGFDWQSNSAILMKDRLNPAIAANNVDGSSAALQAVAQEVHCIEVEQSSTPGEYSTELSLQWYDTQKLQFRTLLRRSAGAGITQLAYQQAMVTECIDQGR